MSLLKKEIELEFSSDPETGSKALNVLGSHFEVTLDEPIQVPHNVVDCRLKVIGASVWNTVPNIREGINDKLHVVSRASPTKTTKEDMGFHVDNTIEVESAAIIIKKATGANLPLNPFVVGDSIEFEESPLAHKRFVINGLDDTNDVNQVRVWVNPASYYLNPGTFDFTRYRPNTGDYALTIPEGTYNVVTLNQAIQRAFEEDDILYQSQTAPISFLPDDATQKVILQFNYDNVEVDFTADNTFHEMLGFEEQKYTQLGDDYQIVAPKVAEFNPFSFLLINTDFIPNGMVYGSTVDKAIARIFGKAETGKQIIYEPINPRSFDARSIVGRPVNRIQFWLTDNKRNQVKTNETWSISLTIQYIQRI